MAENQDFAEELFVDRETVAQEITELGRGLLRIERRDCSPILPNALDNLSVQESILLELATILICSMAGNRQSDLLTRDELVNRCHVKQEVLRARLSDLRKDHMIESLEQGETITVRGLLEVKEILLDMKKEYEEENDN